MIVYKYITMQDQYQDSATIDRVEPTFSEMLQTLTTLQGGSKRHPLDVLERQLLILGNKVRELSQIRRMKMNELRRNIDTYQNQACEELSAAQSFEQELQKSLNQSLKECNKRLDKLQRQRLQRDIEINSIIDEHILTIAEQNEPKEEENQETDSLRERLKEIKERIQEWKVEKNKRISLLRMEVESSFSTQKQLQLLKSKQRQSHILSLKRQLSILQQKLRPKIETLREERMKSEGLILRQLQVIINKLVE